MLSVGFSAALTGENAQQNPIMTYQMPLQGSIEESSSPTLGKRAIVKRDIPDAYLPFWEPYAGPGRLEHTTTLSNWLHIQACGYLEPRDPFPHTWSGMRAVFLSDRDDPHYNTRIPRVLNHVSKKGSPLVRLYLDSPRGRSLHLFKSNAEGRTAQVISLEPIAVERIYSMEVVFPEGA